jgi:hypothetical protein
MKRLDFLRKVCYHFNLKTFLSISLIGTLLAFVLFLIGGCAVVPHRYNCDHHKVVVQAAAACSQDQYCEHTYAMYKEGLQSLDYLKRYCHQEIRVEQGN